MTFSLALNNLNEVFSNLSFPVIKIPFKISEAKKFWTFHLANFNAQKLQTSQAVKNQLRLSENYPGRPEIPTIQTVWRNFQGFGRERAKTFQLALSILQPGVLQNLT